MVEYSDSNRFPFHSGNSSVATYTDDHEGIYELDFVFSRVLERFPSLNPKPFYMEVETIQGMKERERTKRLKDITDSLLHEIKMCLMDENFIHMLYDKWGIGVDSLIKTLYAVYGYYFFTGKRTANAIKKIIDGYKR